MRTQWFAPSKPRHPHGPTSRWYCPDLASEWRVPAACEKVLGNETHARTFHRELLDLIKFNQFNSILFYCIHNFLTVPNWFSPVPGSTGCPILILANFLYPAPFQIQSSPDLGCITHRWEIATSNTVSYHQIYKVYVFVCACAYVYMCSNVHMCACVQICICICTVYAYVYVYVNVCTVHVHTHIHVCIYIYSMYVHIYMYVYV